ncbi:MAG: hypothetical protein WBC83_02915 [Minisyncoccia bacterium]
MRSIERRFEIVKGKNKGVGDYINFAKTVKNQNFSKEMIRRWFTKLVPKEDYDQRDKKQLMGHLANLSSGAEDNGLSGL